MKQQIFPLVIAFVVVSQDLKKKQISMMFQVLRLLLSSPELSLKVRWFEKFKSTQNI